MNTTEAAKILKIDIETLRDGLQLGAFDFGTAYKRPGAKKWTYVIYEHLLWQKVGGKK